MIWSRNVIRTASALFFWAKIHIIPDILVGGSSFFAGNFVGTEKNSTFARQIRINMELKTK